MHPESELASLAEKRKRIRYMSFAMAPFGPTYLHTGEYLICFHICSIRFALIREQAKCTQPK
jgi:hypothetical protein